jgi:nitrilase
MSTPVKAAAVQISPVLYSRQGTVEKVVKKISELGKQGVQFATFSETVVPYYPYFSWVQPPFLMGKEHLRLLEESVTVPSAETHAIGASLRRGRLGQSGWQSRGHRHQSGGAAIRLLRANARDELNFSRAEAA